MGGKVSSPSQDGKHYGRSSGKLPTDLARDPAVPLLRGHLKEEPSVSGKETRHPRIPAAPHTREPNRNRAPVPTGTQTEKDNGVDTDHSKVFRCHRRRKPYPLQQCTENSRTLLTDSLLGLRAAPAADGNSQARRQIRAVATGRHHSHSQAGYQPRLGPLPQLTAMRDSSPTEQGQGSNPCPHRYWSGS